MGITSNVKLPINDKKRDKKIIDSVNIIASLEYIGECHTDWFQDAGYGVMVHY